MFSKNKKRKNELILSYIKHKYDYYNNMYVQASINDSDCEYYLAMKTAYFDIYTYLYNNLK